MVMVPLGAAISGSAMSFAATVMAATNNGTDLAPYVGAAGNGIAVIGLVFVLRAVLSGTLIARPVAQIEASLLGLVERALEREEAFEDIAGRMGFASATKQPRRPR